MRSLASRTLGLPVRVAQPENMIGMTDKLHSPAFSTSIGILHWAVLMTEIGSEPGRRKHNFQGGGLDWENIKNLLKRLLP